MFIFKCRELELYRGRLVLASPPSEMFEVCNLDGIKMLALEVEKIIMLPLKEGFTFTRDVIFANFVNNFTFVVL